jgi:hypothetical protein
MKWSRQQTKISPRAPVRIMGAGRTQNGLGMKSRLPGKWPETGRHDSSILMPLYRLSPGQKSVSVHPGRGDWGRLFTLPRRPATLTATASSFTALGCDVDSHYDWYKNSGRSICSLV